MLKDVISSVVAGLILVGITALIVFGRRLVQIPRQMIIITAALFRLLRSNKLQGTALQKLAIAVKSRGANGTTDDAIDAVALDQNKTDEFFRKVALTSQEHLEELLKEDE
jgi:uncharacterized membrane protein